MAMRCYLCGFDVEDGAAQELSAYAADPLTGAALGAPDVVDALPSVAELP